MTKLLLSRFFTACGLMLIANGTVHAQGRILTSVETAEKQAKQTGRPILAIAGKKT